jgi:hypothetical protein
MELAFSKVVNTLSAVDPSLGDDVEHQITDYTGLTVRVSNHVADVDLNQCYDIGLNTGQYVWLREQLMCEWSLQTIISSIGNAMVFADRPTKEIQIAKAFVKSFSTPPSSSMVRFKPVKVRDDHGRVYLFENGLVYRWRQKCLTCAKVAALRCGGCHRTWFCSQDCQQRSWSLHKPSCKPISLAVNKLANNLLHRLVAILCPPTFIALPTTSSTQDNALVEHAMEEQMYGRLFVRRLHKWEQNIEVKLLMELADEIISQIKQTKTTHDINKEIKSETKSETKSDEKSETKRDEKRNAHFDEVGEEDGRFLLRNCVEIATQIRALGIGQQAEGLFVCMEWGVMLQTCPELESIIRAQQLPDHEILVEFRSLARLEAMRISVRNRSRILNTVEGEMCIGIATTAQPTFRVITLNATATNALRNPSLQPNQIIAAFQQVYSSL